MRLNIEDKLDNDWRFKALVREVGCEWKARGMLFDFWRGAAKYWAEDEGALMPAEEFHLRGFSTILHVGLAREQEGGIYACGMKDQLAWYRKKVEAGRKGGQAHKNRKRDEKGRFESKHCLEKTQAPSKRCLEIVQAVPKPPSPAPSPAPSLKNTNSYTTTTTPRVRARYQADTNGGAALSLTPQDTTTEPQLREDWSTIDLSPLADHGVDQTSPERLRIALQAFGRTPEEVSAGLKYFVYEAVYLDRFKRMRDPVGMFVTIMRRGPYAKPACWHMNTTGEAGEAKLKGITCI